jgi:hypothetical protein
MYLAISEDVADRLETMMANCIRVTLQAFAQHMMT